MQKTAGISSMGGAILRGVVAGLVALGVFIVGVGALSAANGGQFGAVLNAILQTGNWENPGDGTVKNSEKLGGKSASEFQAVTPGQSCPPGQCIVGFETNGTLKCQ